MLPQNVLVKTRKALERLYTDTCTIIEYQEYQKPNKAIGHQEVVVLENQPCRISFKSSDSTNNTESASALPQTVKVFLAPEINVKAGSKLSITRNDVTTEYKNSGEPARYDTHQEITLELFKGWS